MLGLALTKLDAPPGGAPMEMWAFPMEEAGTGAAGALVRMQGLPSGGGGTMVYFSCDDCAVEASRVADVGGSVHMPKFSIGPYGYIALVIDTEGNMVGLHSTK
jgi:predicted enzyme related to lactoylglutathione lyase